MNWIINFTCLWRIVIRKSFKRRLYYFKTHIHSQGPGLQSLTITVRSERFEIQLLQEMCIDSFWNETTVQFCIDLHDVDLPSKCTCVAKRPLFKTWPMLVPFLSRSLEAQTSNFADTFRGLPRGLDAADKASDVQLDLKKSHWSIGKDTALTKRGTGFDSQMSHFLLHQLPSCNKLLTFRSKEMRSS